MMGVRRDIILGNREYELRRVDPLFYVYNSRGEDRVPGSVYRTLFGARASRFLQEKHDQNRR
jgi:hypothetical protein